MGLLKAASFQEIFDIFKLYQVPLHINNEHSLDDMIATLARDKKALKASPRIVLLEAIGKVSPFDGQYCTEVEFPLLEEAIAWMHKEFYRPHG